MFLGLVLVCCGIVAALEGNAVREGGVACLYGGTEKVWVMGCLFGLRHLCRGDVVFTLDKHVKSFQADMCQFN